MVGSQERLLGRKIEKCYSEFIYSIFIITKQQGNLLAEYAQITWCTSLVMVQPIN